MAEGESVAVDVDLGDIEPEKCIRCKSDDIVRWGFTTKNKRQRYLCKNPDCSITFVYKDGFEKMRKPNWAIIESLKGFYRGDSPKDIADALKKKGCTVSLATISRWNKKFIDHTDGKIQRLSIQIGEQFTADETYMDDYDADVLPKALQSPSSE